MSRVYFVCRRGDDLTAGRWYPVTVAVGMDHPTVTDDVGDERNLFHLSGACGLVVVIPDVPFTDDDEISQQLCELTAGGAVCH